MKLYLIIFLINLVFSRDTPPTLEEIANDPKSTIDESSYYEERATILTEYSESDNLMKVFGFDQHKQIYKSHFKNFLKHLIKIEISDQTETEFFEKVINKYIENVPETFNTKDIKKYLELEEFNVALKSTIVELYGDDAFDEFDNYHVHKENNTSDISNNQTNINKTKKIINSHKPEL